MKARLLAVWFAVAGRVDTVRLRCGSTNRTVRGPRMAAAGASVFASALAVCGLMAVAARLG